MSDLTSPSFLALVAAETERLAALTPEERAAAHAAWQKEVAAGMPQPTGYDGPTMPERFVNASFDNYTPYTESQGLALSFAKRIAYRISQGTGPRAALIGNEGGGKSHLLHAIRRELWQTYGLGLGHFCGTWPDIANKLRYGYLDVMQDGTSREVEAKTVRQKLYKAKAIFIDEITPTAATDFDGTELKNLLTHVYDHKIALVITTNITPLAVVMGGPAADRFDQLTITGPTRQERTALRHQQRG